MLGLNRNLIFARNMKETNVKKNEIQVGGIYAAKVSGRIVPVKVLAIREVDKCWRGVGYGRIVHGTTSHYDVLNTVTGRKTTFRSAAKFRHAVKAASRPNPVQVPVEALSTETWRAEDYLPAGPVD